MTKTYRLTLTEEQIEIVKFTLEFVIEKKKLEMQPIEEELLNSVIRQMSMKLGYK